MGWVQRHRWWARGVLLVAIVALLSADGIVVAHRTHAEHVREQAERAAAAKQRAAAARVAYVKALSAPLTSAFRTLQPLEDVILYRELHPAAGVDYPVRDALSHSTASTALRMEASAVTAIEAPPDLMAKATDVHTALTALATLTQGFAAHAKDSGDTLADDLDTGVFNSLDSDALNLQFAVDDLYRAVHQPEPPVASRAGGYRPVALAPSHDSWLLAVDAACNDGENALDGQPTKVTTVTELESLLSYEVKAGDLVGRELAGAKVPANDEVASSIARQLPVFTRFVGDDKAALADLRSGDSQGSVAVLNMQAGLNADFGAIGRAFGAYGADSCATFFSDGPGTSSGGSGSGGGGTSSA